MMSAVRFSLIKFDSSPIFKVRQMKKNLTELFLDKDCLRIYKYTQNKHNYATEIQQRKCTF